MFAQAMPTVNTDPWIWIAGMMTLAIGFLGRELLKRVDAQLTECSQDKRICTTDLGKTSEVLRLTTDAVERSGQTTTGLASVVERMGAEIALNRSVMERVERKLEYLGAPETWRGEHPK